MGIKVYVVQSFNVYGNVECTKEKGKENEVNRFICMRI